MGVNIRYAKLYSDKLKKDLKKISCNSARNFLLKWGHTSSSFQLPEYYKSSGFNKINLDIIDWSKRDGVKITKTLDIFTPKSYLSWRSFNFLNPYIYTHLVHELTEKDNWIAIRDLLTQETLVHTYSLPILL